MTQDERIHPNNQTTQTNSSMNSFRYARRRWVRGVGKFQGIPAANNLVHYNMREKAIQAGKEPCTKCHL